MSQGYKGRPYTSVPGGRFKLELPSIGLNAAMLLQDIERVRAQLGEDGVREFVSEWRKRGHITCTDGEAEQLIKGASQ